MIKEIWLGTAHADGSGKEREGGKRDQPGPGAGSGGAGAELVCLDAGKGCLREQARRSQNDSDSAQLEGPVQHKPSGLLFLLFCQLLRM